MKCLENMMRYMCLKFFIFCGGSTCIKQTLRMKIWLADLKTGVKSEAVSAIPIAFIILTAKAKATRWVIPHWL